MCFRQVILEVVTSRASKGWETRGEEALRRGALGFFPSPADPSQWPSRVFLLFSPLIVGELLGTTYHPHYSRLY